MKDQKAIVIKCIKNDVPCFVIAGDDINALPAVKKYYEAAKQNGADKDFLNDMQAVVDELTLFQKQEPEKVKMPVLKDGEKQFYIK